MFILDYDPIKAARSLTSNHLYSYNRRFSVMGDEGSRDTSRSLVCLNSANYVWFKKFAQEIANLSKKYLKVYTEEINLPAPISEEGDLTFKVMSTDYENLGNPFELDLARRSFKNVGDKNIDDVITSYRFHYIILGLKPSDFPTNTYPEWYTPSYELLATIPSPKNNVCYFVKLDKEGKMFIEESILGGKPNIINDLPDAVVNVIAELVRRNPSVNGTQISDVIRI